MTLQFAIFIVCGLCFNSVTTKSLELDLLKSIEELKHHLQVEGTPEAITKISVLNSRLDSFEPKLFQRFVELRHLTIEFNEISQITSDAFCGLLKLQTLSLKNNGLKYVEKGAFSRLSSLEDLDLSNNLISKLDSNLFEDLVSLKDLRLANNLLINIDRFNRPITNSTNLDFRNNRLETLPSDLLIGATGSELVFSGNKITQIEEGALNGATFLFARFDDNALTTIVPEAFRGFKVYNQLRLSKNKIRLRSQNFQYLGALMGLYLNENEISEIPAGAFEGLKNLETISLRDNKITDIESASFAGLPNLRVLFLGQNPIKTLEGFRSIPSVVFLHLDGCSLDAVDPEAFRDLRQVSVLNLGKNKIVTLPDSKLFGYLPALKNLYFDNNAIGEIKAGAFFDPAISPKEFTFLLLKRNKIRKVEPGAFRGIAKVYSLQLQENELTRLERDTFEGLKYVDTLNLRDNRLEELDDLKYLPASKVVLLGGNRKLEKTDLPLNQLGIENVDYIGFSNYSYHRVGNDWQFVDKPFEQ